MGNDSNINKEQHSSEILLIKQRIIEALCNAGIMNISYTDLKEQSQGVFVFSFLHSHLSFPMLISVKKALGDVKISIEDENRYSFRVYIEWSSIT